MKYLKPILAAALIIAGTAAAEETSTSRSYSYSYSNEDGQQEFEGTERLRDPQGRTQTRTYDHPPASGTAQRPPQPPMAQPMPQSPPRYYGGYSQPGAPSGPTGPGFQGESQGYHKIAP